MKLNIPEYNKIFDTVIGIDPGKGGGIAIYRNEISKSVNMPDQKGLNELFNYYKSVSNNVIVFIEKVQMQSNDFHGGKAFSIQKMLANYVELLTLIKIILIPFIEVFPITWQTSLNLKQKFEDVYNYEMIKELKEEKQTDQTKKAILSLKGSEKTLRKNRYKDVAQKEYPGIKVTLKNADALLILKFGRIKLENSPKYIYDKIQNYNDDKLF